jgi:hypothetical protein
MRYKIGHCIEGESGGGGDSFAQIWSFQWPLAKQKLLFVACHNYLFFVLQT